MTKNNDSKMLQADIIQIIHLKDIVWARTGYV